MSQSGISDQKIYVPGAGDGVPATPFGAQTLVGSGSAVPGGLECVFEYNGLFLNVQRNVDRYKVKQIDGLFDADIRDTRDPSTNSDGETPYNSFYGGRTIVISGTIETFSVPKLRDMQMALRAALSDVSTEYPLYFRTGDFDKDHLIYCKKIASSNLTEQQQNMMVQRDFQISLRASNPRFLSYYQQSIDVSPQSPAVEGSPVLVGTCVNSGNYKAQPIFRVYGPSNGTTWTNDATGQSFSLGPIAYNDWFEFNMGSPPSNVKYLINSVGDNEWNQLQDGSQYIDLVGIGPDKGTIYDGQNNIFYFGNCSRVIISWRNSWI